MRRTSERRRAGVSSTHAKHALIGRVADEIAPPLLETGKARCPVCRNAATVTSRGYLRRHRDLFGHNCHNVATT